ncbi:MAG: DNA repair protein RecO [Rikenellaceae bacterium]|nr:DNA repair protein RecO [Rikenellaceae bacterium]
MKTYKGRGIVLHTLKYGDSSLVVQLLTDVGGRRSYMVQGVRSRSGRGSKLALFQPAFPVEFEGLEPSQSQQMHRFKEVRGGFLLQGIPFDVRKSTMAIFIAEVIYRLVKESEQNESLFDFVWNSVAALDSMQEGVANFHLWFLVKLSRLVGFQPGNEHRAGDWFDIKEGLYVPLRPLHPLHFAPEEASLMSHLMQLSVLELGDLALNRHQRVAFLNAMLTYFGYHLDAIHTVQSVRILQEVF